MELTCPKCQASMRQYERSGVHVDQCVECRGIFLDRGEVERLIDAETTVARRTAAPPPTAQPSPQQPAYEQQPYQQQRYQQQPYQQQPYPPHKKKKRSFLEDL